MEITMWTDILTTSVIIGFIGLTFRFHQSKINKLEDKKVGKELFKQSQEAIKKDLKRGEEKFDKISEILSGQAVMLGRIDERVLNLAKKNGVE